MRIMEEVFSKKVPMGEQYVDYVSELYHECSAALQCHLQCREAAWGH